jgi:dTDP-4-dehydrorhamnose reductase
LRSKPIAHVVEEFFQATVQKKATINDVLKHYVEKYGENNPIEMKKARHAIYLKIHRLVKSGVLVVASKSGKSTHYAQAKILEEAKKQKTIPIAVVASENEMLLKRKAELEYELELCIAEAQGYEEMKSILPTQLDLLISKKSEAKKRAITLNGLLTSTQNILHALS